MSKAHGGIDPSPWVTRFAPLIHKDGEILDLACGGGRHTRFLHGLGHSIVSLDRDTSKLDDLRGAPGIEIMEADLETGQRWPLTNRCFSGIIVTNYLFRPLFPTLLGALAEGGVLIYETFAIGNERFGKPSNPDYLLEPGELLAVVEDRLRIVAFEQGQVDRPRDAVIERICAVNTSDLTALPAR